MEGTGKLRGKMTDYTSDKISQEMPRTKQFFKRTIFKKKKKFPLIYPTKRSREIKGRSVSHAYLLTSVAV